MNTARFSPVKSCSLSFLSNRTLTDVKLTDLPSLRRALTVLHEHYRVPNVVISSIPLAAWLQAALPPRLTSALDDSESPYLLCISSSANSSEGALSTVHAQTVPLLPGYFSGVGDLFSALLLAHFVSPLSPPPSPDTPSMDTVVSLAASHALTKTHAILCLTYTHSETLPPDERAATDDEQDAADPLRQVKRMRGRELRLVQGQDILRGVGLEGVTRREMLPWTDFWESD